MLLLDGRSSWNRKFFFFFFFLESQDLYIVHSLQKGDGRTELAYGFSSSSDSYASLPSLLRIIFCIAFACLLFVGSSFSSESSTPVSRCLLAALYSRLSRSCMYQVEHKLRNPRTKGNHTYLQFLCFFIMFIQIHLLFVICKIFLVNLFIQVAFLSEFFFPPSLSSIILIIK